MDLADIGVKMWDEKKIKWAVEEAVVAPQILRRPRDAAAAQVVRAAAQDHAVRGHRPRHQA